jgi:hypothetical protein
VLQQVPGSSIAKLLATEIFPSNESCTQNNEDTKASTPKMIFAVSAALRKGTDGFDIQLLNGWLRSNGADDALNRVLQLAGAKYPNYSPIKTLVNELRGIQAACSVQRPASRQWKAA